LNEGFKMIARLLKHFSSQRLGGDGQSGQALIETALSGALLILFLLGAACLGRVSYTAIEVSNAARAAAQYGAMNGGAFLPTDSTGLDSAGMLTAAQSDAGNLGALVQFSSGYPTYTCSCSGSGTASCTPPATPSGCATSHIIVTIQVQTTASFNPLVFVPGLGHSFTLYGTAQEQVLQ
jgi:hypothetical protein